MATPFPTALDGKTDLSLSEILEENKAADIDWWGNFTKYYDGVLKETNGHMDDPETLICYFTSTLTLKIEQQIFDRICAIGLRTVLCMC